MSIYTRMLRQTAVHWPKTGTAADGTPEWGEPREVACRWEDKNEEFVSTNNRAAISKAVVYVDPLEEVNPGDVLALGRFLDLEDETDPYANEVQAWEVQAVGRNPSLKQDDPTKVLQTVWL